MTVTKFLFGTGLAIGIAGGLLLIFQATLLLVFAQWYSFSMLDLLVRLNLHDALATGVPGIDQMVDWGLSLPLPVVLLVIGGLIAYAAHRTLADEIKWSHPD